MSAPSPCRQRCAACGATDKPERHVYCRPCQRAVSAAALRRKERYCTRCHCPLDPEKRITTCPPCQRARKIDRSFKGRLYCLDCRTPIRGGLQQSYCPPCRSARRWARLHPEAAARLREWGQEIHP